MLDVLLNRVQRLHQDTSSWANEKSGEREPTLEFAGDGLLTQLREMDPPTTIDLTGPANVMPPRSKQEFALQLRRMVVDELEVLTSFAATGIYTEAIGVLDQTMHSSSFGILARELIAIQAYITMDDEGEAVRSLVGLMERLDRVAPRL